jgi:hypothetical protein
VCATKHYYSALAAGGFVCEYCPGDQISQGSGEQQVCGCPDTAAYSGQLTNVGCGECGGLQQVRCYVHVGWV